MKTAISIPNDVFRAADKFARHKKLSRSAVFTKAVTEYLCIHGREDITEQLNKVYCKHDSPVDPVMNELQLKSIPKEKW